MFEIKTPEFLNYPINSVGKIYSIRPIMKLNIFLLAVCLTLVFSYSNMKETGTQGGCPHMKKMQKDSESDCPYFKQHGMKDCPCKMSKEEMEKCPHLLKLKEEHGEKPGCPYKDAMKDKIKGCPHMGDKECPCKKTGGCPHMKKKGCPYAEKESLNKAGDCPYFKQHGMKDCPCKMSKEELEKCPHLLKMKEEHGDKPGCPYKDAVKDGKDCPYMKNHSGDKECPCKKLKSSGGCPHMKKMEEAKKKEEL
jgi:hypothetical protein